MAAIGRMVPGVSSELLEREHLARYRFACEFASHRTVLDVACGMGYSAPLFMAAGARRYTGIDLDEDAIAAASKQYAVTDGVRFQVGDACELAGFSPRSIDLVVSFETIEHLPRPEAFLQNVSRILRPDGTFIVSTPHRLRYSPGNELSSRPWNRFHMREWNSAEFLELLNPHFRVLQVLGQMPIPAWKANAIHFAARYRWAGAILDRFRKARRTVDPAAQSANLPDRTHAVQQIPIWQAPLYIVCLAKPRLDVE